MAKSCLKWNSHDIQRKAKHMANTLPKSWLVNRVNHNRERLQKMIAMKVPEVIIKYDINLLRVRELALQLQIAKEN
jgi:hypothetical protein